MSTQSPRVPVRAYLDYAGLGPLRNRTVDAMRRVLDEVYTQGTARLDAFLSTRPAARAAAAWLLECAPDEVALVPNTSTGIHLVADGLRWRAGDEIVVFDGDFPANVHPWCRLAERENVRLSWIPMRGGRYELDDVAAAIRPATRLIALSHVNFATGFRLDLDALCALAAHVGALVCVDAVQSLGALPLSVAQTPVDFVAAGGHKWLCGPPGTGVFYCRADRLALLERIPCGWLGFDNALDMLTMGPGHLRYDRPLRESAGRVEGGMYDIAGVAGLCATLEELANIGTAAISERISMLTQRLYSGLAELGYVTEHTPGKDSWSGIVSFTDPRRDPGVLVEQLRAEGIRVSFPDGKVRASPHYWTDEQEVDLLLDVLARAARTTSATSPAG